MTHDDPHKSSQRNNSGAARSAGEERTAPHKVANELLDVDDDRAAPGRGREPKRPHEHPPHSDTGARRDRAVRSVSRTLLLVILGLLIVAFMVASVAFESWFGLIIAAIVAAVYMLVIGAPVWLAMATKGAQDASADEKRR
jgi:hypothetical protein